MEYKYSFHLPTNVKHSILRKFLLVCAIKIMFYDHLGNIYTKPDKVAIRPRFDTTYFNYYDSLPLENYEPSLHLRGHFLVMKWYERNSKKIKRFDRFIYFRSRLFYVEYVIRITNNCWIFKYIIKISTLLTSLNKLLISFEAVNVKWSPISRKDRDLFNYDVI